MRLLFSATFALWVAAWLTYFYAWNHARPSYRARWILASAVCSVLGAMATAALFIGMLLQ